MLILFSFWPMILQKLKAKLSYLTNLQNKNNSLCNSCLRRGNTPFELHNYYYKQEMKGLKESKIKGGWVIKWNLSVKASQELKQSHKAELLKSR